ncbi:hypothetical protein MWV29_001512 [Escherichia coli]|nr:hypothetical protein [Escherichia coli]
MEWEVGKIYNIKCEVSKAELTKFSPSINNAILDLIGDRSFKVEALDADGDVSKITIIGEETEPMTLRESPINFHGVWFWSGERRFFTEVTIEPKIPESEEKEEDLTLERLGLLMEAYDIQLIDKMGLHNSIAKITTLEGIKSVLDGMPSRIGAIREYKQTRDRMIQLESRIKNER